LYDNVNTHNEEHSSTIYNAETSVQVENAFCQEGEFRNITSCMQIA